MAEADGIVSHALVIRPGNSTNETAKKAAMQTKKIAGRLWVARRAPMGRYAAVFPAGGYFQAKLFSRFPMARLPHMTTDPRKFLPAMFNAERTNPETPLVRAGITGFLKRLKIMLFEQRECFGNPLGQIADKQRHVLGPGDFDHAINLIGEVLQTFRRISVPCLFGKFAELQAEISVTQPYKEI